MLVGKGLVMAWTTQRTRELPGYIVSSDAGYIVASDAATLIAFFLLFVSSPTRTPDFIQSRIRVLGRVLPRLRGDLFFLKLNPPVNSLTDIARGVSPGGFQIWSR